MYVHILYRDLSVRTMCPCQPNHRQLDWEGGRRAYTEDREKLSGKDKRVETWKTFLIKELLNRSHGRV